MDKNNFLKTAALAAAVSIGTSFSYNASNHHIEDKVDSILEEQISSYENQRDEAYRDHTQKILENIIPITSFVTYSTPLDPEPQNVRIEEDGIIVNHEGDYYILTVAHNVSRDRIMTDEGVYRGTTINSETSWAGVDIENVHLDTERDIAIFQFPDELPEGFEKSEYDIIMGESDSLRVFDNIYLIGNPAHSGTHIREGIVASPEEERYFSSSPSFSSEGVGLSLPARPGDSGRPVVRPHHDPDEGHSLELVGLLKESHHYGMSSYMAPIDWFKDNM